MYKFINVINELSSKFYQINNWWEKTMTPWTLKQLLQRKINDMIGKGE